MAKILVNSVFFILLLYPVFLNCALNSIEKDFIQQLRSRLGVENLITRVTGSSTAAKLADEHLDRWLKFANNDVAKAERAIRRSTFWMNLYDREKNLLTWESKSPQIKANLAYEQTGYSHTGEPVFYIPFGKWDLVKLTSDKNSETRKDTLRYIVQLYERAYQSTIGLKNPLEKDGKVGQVVFILDFGGYSPRNLFSPRALYLLLRAALIIENNYPLLVKKYYVVRAPAFSPVIVGVLSSVLNSKTLKSFEVYRQERQYKSVLGGNLPKDVIPQSLGGNKTLRI